MKGPRSATLSSLFTNMERKYLEILYQFALFLKARRAFDQFLPEFITKLEHFDVNLLHHWNKYANPETSIVFQTFFEERNLRVLEE